MSARVQTMSRSVAHASAVAVLSVRGLSARYGRIRAVEEASLTVGAGTITALIGANGAGKTTLLRVLSGIHPSDDGTIVMNGVDITRARSQARVRAGMAQVPEGRQVFGPLSVADNLRLGGFLRSVADNEATLKEVYALFPALYDKRDQPAGNLSGGQQQMLAMGRALMSRPTLMLLDEPSMGLVPKLVAEVFAVVQRLRGQGVSILLVEQNAHAALDIADHAYVLETGRIVLDGSGEFLRHHPDVKDAYLGGL